jgi:hypothetical protein
LYRILYILKVPKHWTVSDWQHNVQDFATYCPQCLSSQDLYWEKTSQRPLICFSQPNGGLTSCLSSFLTSLMNYHIHEVFLMTKCKKNSKIRFLVTYFHLPKCWSNNTSIFPITAARWIGVFPSLSAWYKASWMDAFCGKMKHVVQFLKTYIIIHRIT